MGKFKRLFGRCLLAGLLLSQTACLEWLHAYQTYLQMEEFDRYFSVTAQEDFTVHFKEPKLLSEDFVALAKLQASSEEQVQAGKRWRYQFRKIDQQQQLVSPEIGFYCELVFDREDKVTAWSFSKLFLQIAPPEFLEASFRSLGGAEINEGKKQLRANAALAGKVSAELPKKAKVLAQLGEPLAIETEDEFEIYQYQFRLDAREIEEGYEDRALSEVKLSFDKNSGELVKMSGRFAGLKISINYRDFKQNDKANLASL